MESWDDAVRLIESVESECGAGFALAVRAVAGVDDERGGSEGVADEGAGTAAVEEIFANGTEDGATVSDCVRCNGEEGRCWGRGTVMVL